MRSREWIMATAFLAPALFFYTLFLAVPLVGTLVLGFTEWSGFNFSDIRFVGLDNFRQMGSDSIFWQALGHNLIFLCGAIGVKTFLALLIALALEQNLRFSSFFRGVYLMPTVLSLVVIGLVFSFALSSSLGFVNPLLQNVGLGSFAGDWLGDQHRVLPVLILIDAWGGFGLFMFLFLIRIMSIPQELHDAAYVDGASGFQHLWFLTLPLLKRTASMVVLLASIEALKSFALIYVMTNGGPNHGSEVLSTWAYFNAFTANKVGYGSAVLVILLMITFVFAFIQVTRSQSIEDF